MRFHFFSPPVKLVYLFFAGAEMGLYNYRNEPDRRTMMQEGILGQEKYYLNWNGARLWSAFWLYPVL